ncbi:MAG: extracellular solute-binding protein [Candidatus Methanosuratus sp.]|nr:extracellular solute-binding protein [Candidatus Methanosuratincola sp.]
MKNHAVVAVVILVAMVLGACAPATPEVIEKEVVQTVVVEKEVPVEKKVVETVVVEKEVVVTPTPAPPVEKVPGACNVAAPNSPVTIDMIGWAFPITEFYAEELKTCNKVQNLTVNVKLLDSPSAQEQVRLALSGRGESPFEIIHAANAQMIEWGSNGWLMPLNALVAKYRDEYDLDDISQAAWDAATIDGKIYGIPIVANTLHLMYRTDLFEKYNIDVPTTYDEVMEACQVLKQEPSIDLPFTLNLHAGWAWEQEFFHFLRSFGGDYLNEDNTPAFNSPEGVAALNKLKEVADACMGMDGLTWSVDDSEIGLETGRLAFADLWASRAANMDDPEKSDFVGTIGFAPAAAPKPGGKLGASAWNDFYCIPASVTVDPDLIFRIIMEASDLESQMRAAEFGIVTRMTVAKEGVGGRYLSAALETIEKGVGAYPPSPALPLVRSALGNYLPLVGSGELTPEEALQKAADDYVKEATIQGFIK